MKKIIFILFYLTFAICLLPTAKSQQPIANYQYPVFTKADSLRGTLSPLRVCYDVSYYHLTVKVFYEEKKIEGSNVIRFRAMQDFNKMQIDLVKTLNISRIIFHEKELAFERIENAVMITFAKTIVANTNDEITVYYDGIPLEASNPPWDGGWVWKKDNEGKTWIGTACEGLGASTWWPCKDHLSDEPDSMQISIIIPKGLMAVSNGNLRQKVDLKDNWERFDWYVSYPINNYNVTVNIGNYKTISETYTNASGAHKLDYYVLAYNVDKAKKHFQQVKKMLKTFEYYFGEYPFWRDGYALVETSFWGMEHQSAIAYGNEYRNNEFGFDFIIIHESGHEWFGNSLSMPDRSDMWIHESFTTYAEALFLEHTHNPSKAIAYLRKQRLLIKNSEPIVGPVGVSYDGWPDADMYYKGTWMLHTLRNAVNDDKLWFQTLKQFTEHFRIQSVTTNEAISFFNQHLGRDYTWLFKEYLYHTEFPVLEYKIMSKANQTEVSYRWVASENNFTLPVSLKYGKTIEKWNSTTEWQTKTYNTNSFSPSFIREQGLYEIKQVL